MYFEVIDENGKELDLGHFSNKDVSEYRDRSVKEKVCKIVSYENEVATLQLGKGEYVLEIDWECYQGVAGFEVEKYSKECVLIEGKRAYDSNREVTYPSETKMVWKLLNKNSYFNKISKNKK